MSWAGGGGGLNNNATRRAELFEFQQQLYKRIIRGLDL